MKATRPLNVLYTGNRCWVALKDGQPVHLIALFREPGIAKTRRIEHVLDIHQEDGVLRAGKNCWVSKILQCLADLPSGLGIALHNGVDVPLPKKRGFDAFRAKAKEQWSDRKAWIKTQVHPDGRPPHLLLCDR